jgi:hypothetical protein
MADLPEGKPARFAHSMRRELRDRRMLSSTTSSSIAAIGFLIRSEDHRARFAIVRGVI